MVVTNKMGIYQQELTVDRIIHSIRHLHFKHNHGICAVVCNTNVNHSYGDEWGFGSIRKTMGILMLHINGGCLVYCGSMG